MNRLFTFLIICALFLIGSHSTLAQDFDAKKFHKFTQPDPASTTWRVNWVLKDSAADPDLFMVGDLFQLDGKDLASEKVYLRPGKKMKGRMWKSQDYALDAEIKNNVSFICGLVPLLHKGRKTRQHWIAISERKGFTNEIELQYADKSEYSSCSDFEIHGGLVHADR